MPCKSREKRCGWLWVKLNVWFVSFSLVFHSLSFVESAIIEIDAKFCFFSYKDLFSFPVFYRISHHRKWCKIFPFHTKIGFHSLSFVESTIIEINIKFCFFSYKNWFSFYFKVWHSVACPTHNFILPSLPFMETQKYPWFTSALPSMADPTPWT